MPKKKLSGKKRNLLLKLLIILVILVILFIVFCYITPKEVSLVKEYEKGEKIPYLELPEPIPGEQIVSHTGYTLSYNEKYEQPSYVAYELTKDEVLGQYSRADNFRADPEIITGSATLSDYRNSGYDRGHLAPAADFKWSEEAMDDTFYLSNMSPQAPQFNRNIWADLEAVVRTMAYDNNSIYVVTGPVLTDGPYETIGKNEVAVPKYFYKVILDYEEPELKAIGFILPNEGSKEPLEKFAVSVDTVEEVTGIDFYPRLPDEDELLLESTFDTSQWSFRKYMPNGETGVDLSYVTDEKDVRRDAILDLIAIAIVEFKKNFFELTNTSDLARKLNLL